MPGLAGDLPAVRRLGRWLWGYPGRVPGLAGDLPAVHAAWLWPALAIGLLAALLWPAFGHAVEVWSTTEEFSYGFLIPIASALIIWWQRRELRRAIGVQCGTAAGLLVAIPALVLYLLAQRAGIHALAGLVACPLLWGTALSLWGWEAGRVLAFPIGYLAFGLGLYRGLLDSVGFALQELTARGAAAVVQLAGAPLVREGLVLRLGDLAFVVAEPCSGMSSLLSLLALAALWIYLARGPLAGRAVLLASVGPLVIMANISRVALVLLVGRHFGQEVALGFFHSASSLILFGFALAGLLAVGWLVGCKPLRFAPSS